VLTDIKQSYADPVLKAQLDLSMFPTDEFVATCETEQLATDELYAK
jgi:hypothetical protein